MASKKEEFVEEQESKESMNPTLKDATNKLTIIQNELKLLKQLISDADLININRQNLIERTEKMNAFLKEINFEKSDKEFSSVPNYNPEKFTSEMIKVNIFKKRRTQMESHNNRISESLTYLKNMTTEILNYDEEIKGLRNNTIVFDGSNEEKHQRIKELENEERKHKEDMFHYIKEMIDINYENKELIQLLEEENGVMENEINYLKSMTEQLQEENKCLLFENKRLKVHSERWKPKGEYCYEEEPGNDSMSSNERELKRTPMSSISAFEMQKIEKRLQNDHHTITITHAKLQQLKENYKSTVPKLINLDTYIDPRIHSAPRGHYKQVNKINE